MSINQAAPDLALIAQSAADQLEAALVLSCLEDPDGSAAIAQAMTDGITQLFLALGPLQLSALDANSALPTAIAAQLQARSKAQSLGSPSIQRLIA